jgi:uncharacterized protein YigE (DUF2233 family)
VRFDLQRFRPEVVVTGKDKPTTAVVNGGFFDEHRQPFGLRISEGRTVVPLRRRVDWGVLILRPGRAQIVHSRDFKADSLIEGAIQAGPRLLAAGRSLRLKPQVARRSAVAVDRDGRTLTLLVTRTPADAGRLAALLGRLGFYSALMLDGGASTQMSVAVGAFTVDVSGLYGVPDALVVRGRWTSARRPTFNRHGLMARD